MSERIRLVLVARSLEIGGAEVQVSALARGLDRSRFDVHVLCLYRRGQLGDELQSAGVPVTYLDKGGRWDFVRFFARFVARLRRLRPHVVHSFLSAPNIFSAAATPWLRGTRLVWGVRASDMDLASYDWSWRVASWLERVLASRVDRIVANAAAGRVAALAQGLPGARLGVIPNGIDTDRYRPSPAERTRVRAEWQVPAGQFLLGLTARVDPMKDHETFLAAAALLHARRPEIRFVCVGDGPEPLRSTLRDKAHTLGLTDCLLWAGARRDMNAVYNALDAATLTSAFGEGFPNAVGEAMATGRPCVVTNVGDAAIVVGETGRVVPKRDAPALAAAWEQLAVASAVERQRHGEQARARIVTEFSVGTMVAAYEREYSALAGVAR